MRLNDLRRGTTLTGAELLPMVQNGKVVSTTAGELAAYLMASEGGTWYSGSGSPLDSLGVDGDLYLNTTSGSVFVKASGTWGSPTVVLKGTNGTNGSTWLLGTGLPDNAVGLDGDFYLDRTANEIYRKSSGAWSAVGNLAGQNGVGVPAGGLAGQRLIKLSDADFDTAWTYDRFIVTTYCQGTPDSNAKLLRVPVTAAITFPANFAGSQATASVAATVDTVFSVQAIHAGSATQIGTVTFLAGAVTGVFASTGSNPQSLLAADILAIIAPATADATLADIGFALTGTHQ